MPLRRLSDIKRADGMVSITGDHRFRVERVVELGLREQIRLECSVA